MTQILTFARSNPKELRRFAKFLVVGAFGFVVDFGGFNLFHVLGIGTQLARLVPASFFPVSDYLTGHPEVIEQALSFCCAVLSNFLWNYFWLYPEARDANQASKMSKFIIVSVAGLFIGVPVFGAALYVARGLVKAAGLSALAFNLAGNMALVCRVAVLLFWNFFVNRFWTYRDVPVA
jgi:putative flippase GtrA